MRNKIPIVCNCSEREAGSTTSITDLSSFGWRRFSERMIVSAGKMNNKVRMRRRGFGAEEIVEKLRGAEVVLCEV
jgi:hypothetical protein